MVSGSSLGLFGEGGNTHIINSRTRSNMNNANDGNEDKDNVPSRKRTRSMQSGDSGTTMSMDSKVAIMPNEEGKTAEETKKKLVDLDDIQNMEESALLDLQQKIVKALSRKKKSSELSQPDNQTDIFASSAKQKSSTESPAVPTSNTPTIDLYLSRNVKAVPLPDIFGEDGTFPPLILDGASGVGKTQQAFALLRSIKECKLIYLNLAEINDNSQRIYKEMYKYTRPYKISYEISNAMKKVKSFKANQEEDDGTDRFSNDALKKRLLLIFDAPELVDLKKLVEALQKIILVHEDSQIRLLVPDAIMSTFAKMEEIFGGVVFFIDEAVPPKKSDAPEDRAKLRFLCNLGCAMGMRVVLAGTAATAANMISLDKDCNFASRMGSKGGSSSNAWAEIVFLWQEIEEETFDTILPENLLQKITPRPCDELKIAIRKERPLVAVLMGEVLKELKSEKADVMAILKSVGDKLRTMKHPSKHSHLIWLAGPWLDGAYQMPAALQMQAPELVCGHFFEPAIAVDSQRCPLFDPGLCSIPDFVRSRTLFVDETLVSTSTGSEHLLTRFRSSLFCYGTR